jgi:hypothetical protein
MVQFLAAALLGAAPVIAGPFTGTWVAELDSQSAKWSRPGHAAGRW